MIAGLPAGYQRFTAPSLGGFGFQALTPADLDGSTSPPAGAPGFFLRHRDDELHDPGANDPTRDFLEVWELHADFGSPASSTFTLAATIAVAEFDSELCVASPSSCFPQPAGGTPLDPIREVVMWRAQYRNFGGYETLVGNFVTDVDGTDHGGLRWFELRGSGGGPWGLFPGGPPSPAQPASMRRRRSAATACARSARIATERRRRSAPVSAGPTAPVPCPSAATTSSSWARSATARLPAPAPREDAAPTARARSARRARPPAAAPPSPGGPPSRSATRSTTRGTRSDGSGGTAPPRTSATSRTPCTAPPATRSASSTAPAARSR